jgi:hypothetical protein
MLKGWRAKMKVVQQEFWIEALVADKQRMVYIAFCILDRGIKVPSNVPYALSNTADVDADFFED